MALTEMGLQMLGLGLLVYSAWQFASWRMDRRTTGSAKLTSLDGTVKSLNGHR